MKRLLLPLLLLFSLALYSQRSENGYYMPNKGTLRIFLVYAEVINDPNYNNINEYNWPAGQLPNNPDYYFSYHPDENEGRLTHYFHEASFDSFNVVGDYYPELVQIDYSKVTYMGTKQVIEYINNNSGKRVRTAKGYRIMGEPFDTWTLKGNNAPKINKPDSLADIIMVVWRVNSKLSPTTNSGYCSMGGFKIKFKGYNGFNCYSEFVSHNNDAFTIMRHEFSHTLYGGNNFHTAGPGAGVRCFLHPIGGYSNLSSWDHMNDCWNGWDRWRMGWKNPLKQFTISGYENINGNWAERNFEYFGYNKDSLLVYIRDFRTTGDALRIKLPGIDSPALNQYLWLENHADTSTFDFTTKERCGLYAYVQVGKDDNTKLFDGGTIPSPGNYLYFLPATGRHDYEYGTDSIKKKTFMKKVAGLSNPLMGNHTIMRPLIDVNHNEKLDEGEAQVPEMIINEKGDTIVAYPTFGRADDAFGLSGNSNINISSNPSSANVTTYMYPYRNNGKYDTDTVWLNGLNITIADSGNINIKGKKEEAIGIKIKWNDYNIKNSVRWCGNIGAKPFYSKTVTIDVTNNSTLLLDRGLSVVQHTLNKTDTLNGQFYFSKPTVMICYPGITLHIRNGSTLKLSNKSTLIIKKGATLIIDKGATVDADESSAIVRE